MKAVFLIVNAKRALPEQRLGLYAEKSILVKHIAIITK